MIISVFIVGCIVALYLAVISYLLGSSSYSNSYVAAAIKRHGKKFSAFNIFGLLVFDRSIMALMAYRLNYRIANPLVGRIITNAVFFLTGIEIYYNAKIGFRTQIWHGQGTVIGQNAIIGDDCLILHQVTLGSGFVVLGDRVKVGAGAKILGSISIADDCVVGANAVVTRSLPHRTMVTLTMHEQLLCEGREIAFGTKL